jgi:competence ComEA-like helix-hairpin-helix protein
VVRGRGILKRVGRLYKRSSAEQPEGEEQDPAEGRDPESDDRPAGAEQSMSRLAFRRPHPSEEGVPKAPEQVVEAPGKSRERAEEAAIVPSEAEEPEVKTAEGPTGAEAQRRIHGPDESFKQKFAEAERKLEEMEARLQAAEQLAARAEHVAWLHADKPGQVRRPKEAEPNDWRSSPDTKRPHLVERADEDGDGINLQTASCEELRELGMSSTQAKRILDYRERNDGFNSVDDLDQLPGFSRDALIAVKQKLVV